ncbi:MAG: isoleucine--tRNA ligase [Gemmataceae bacterium]
MGFEKVEIVVDFPAQERAILQFWENTGAFEAVRCKNQGKKPWSFLDGPITANNPMGVHHAWGRTYKDAFQRFFAMTGHELRYQNGFDCQGLWVEVEVEKELGLKSKQDIENLVPGDRFASIDRFVQLCKARVDRFARIQTQQSMRLGYWMDWDREEDFAKPPDARRSYYTMSEENNYTIWAFLKKCHQRGLIYRAYDAMPWCPRCAVGISQMEMHEGYERVAHKAVFVRLPLRGRQGEYLLVWTTTPWTLSSNVAAAVHPQLTYVRLRHRDEVYYAAKGALTAERLAEEFRRGEWVPGVPKLKTLAQILNERGGYEILEELPGERLVGWTYDGPFDDLPAQNSIRGYPADIAKVVANQNWAPAVSARQAHRVIAWDAVGETEGTGIVHIAPGCGQEDFELGKAEGLPPIAPLDEQGVFLDGFGFLSGRSAADPTTADLIIEHLRSRGLLLAVERYPHNYPHCWRCKTELLFRLVDEWYISMSWRQEIMRVCYDITWIPEFGLQRELDWLRNMGDWMISKKRYWGLALPIWVCEACGGFDVIGGRCELQERALEGWERFAGHSPHRPWVDLITVRCPHCGGTARRIPDVGNPWLDAGIVPFSTMRYNPEFHPDDPERTYWNKWFPADFITECFPGQFRNWFYALLAMSTMLVGQAPFRTLLGHALVRDEKGEEMHKSKGNAIPFEGAADTGYALVVRELKPNENEEKALRSQPLPPGALSVEIGELEREGKKIRVLKALYPPMSADLIRWMFCRHNPAVNINFGPGPAEEIRNRFLLKLWNVYAFFCNYARLDGFDPDAPQVPLARRPDIDRWILSDLQLLVRLARQEFPRFNLQPVCLEVERFVEDKLSNWYVRRNRRRFWKSEQGEDKWAAYQTLYEVLLTLAKLLAPMLPFLTEVMYQNLAISSRGGPRQGVPFSIHLCDYPQEDESLLDPDLSEDMEAVLKLVSLGLAARNQAKIKVRQPLNEARFFSCRDQDRRALDRFREQIADELNVKKVTWLDPVGSGVARLIAKPKAAELGQRVGPLLEDVARALQNSDLAQALRAGQTVTVPLPAQQITVSPSEVDLELHPVPGWTALEEKGLIVALHTTITPELKLEGVTRDLVRHIQNLRKQANLQLEDRIVLYLGSDSPEIVRAVEKHRDYISAETLTARWSDRPLGAGAACAEVKLAEGRVRVELQRV